MSDSTTEQAAPAYCGRFAPSPTGHLHFGSLVAALGSYLQARHRGGQWLLRVEDIDPPREVPGSANSIIQSLTRLGMNADGAVVWQSQRRTAYWQALQQLMEDGHAYWCGCSRAQIPAGKPYPGTCRNGLAENVDKRAIRVKVDDRQITFHDLLHGQQSENLNETCGDFVIWRADDLPAYQLAVVVDDAFQGINEVVRGKDLLSSTARQVHLQRLLQMPTPEYVHLPLVTGPDGKKLSKRLHSDPINTGQPLQVLSSALTALGQDCPDTPDPAEWWQQASEGWQLLKVPLTSIEPSGLAS